MRAVPATLRTWLWRIRYLIWNVVFDSRCSRLDWNNKIKIKQYLHFAKCFLCLSKALTSCYLCQSELDLPSSTDSDTVDTVEIFGALFAVIYIKELKHGFPGDFAKRKMLPIYMMAHLTLSHSCWWDRDQVLHVEVPWLFPTKCSYFEQFKLKF